MYVHLNTKIIYMPILEDDHLISLGLMALTLSSAIFSVPWGFLADKKGPFFAILVFSVLDLAVKLYATLDQSKAGFLIGMTLIGSTEKAMLIFFAPIMIDTFGLQAANSLLFLKGVAGIISMVFISVFGILMSNVPPNQALLWLCTFNVINIGLALTLSKRTENSNRKTNI